MLFRSLSATACVLEDSLDLTFDRLVYVAHESLLERPADVMASVRESLRLPTATERRPLVDAIERVRRGRVDRYDSPLPAKVNEAAVALRLLQAKALAGPTGIAR